MKSPEALDKTGIVVRLPPSSTPSPPAHTLHTHTHTHTHIHIKGHFIFPGTSSYSQVLEPSMPFPVSHTVFMKLTLTPQALFCCTNDVFLERKKNKTRGEISKKKETTISSNIHPFWLCVCVCVCVCACYRMEHSFHWDFNYLKLWRLISHLEILF